MTGGPSARPAPKPGARGLGRGLSALFGDATDGDGAQTVRTLPIEQLAPGRYQPRRRFDEQAVAGLADSIRERGILQPLLVRAIGADRYEIVAGERRWRAAQRAGLHEVPALVRTLADSEALELALVENLQREDLSAIEEADGYRRLIEEFGHTQEALAQVVGKSRSHVANTLRLLALPDSVKTMVLDGTLSAGHARALLALPDPASAAAEVVRRGLNVRQTEALVRNAQRPSGAPDGGGSGADAAASGPSPRASGRFGGSARAHADPDTEALETELSLAIGMPVSIETQADGSGRLVIRYDSLDQLDLVLSRLR